MASKMAGKQKEVVGYDREKQVEEYAVSQYHMPLPVQIC